jgi:hypothetical protein
LQVFESTQESGILVHENLHVVSQPVFAPLPAPKSQSSPLSVMPLPHTDAGGRQAPFWQTLPPPHPLPFWVGSAATAHWCAMLHEATWHAGAAGQSVAGVTHEKVQSPSQPSPSMRLPSSQVSPGSTSPFGHTGVVHTPILQ